MDLNKLLDAPISVDGSPMPTLREIIEQHFAGSATQASIGKIVAREYIGLLGAAAGPADTAESPEPAARAEAAKDEPRKPSEAENILKSFGLPIDDNGRIDLKGAIAGAMSPEGTKTPVGVLFGGLMRAVAEGAKPKG